MRKEKSMATTSGDARRAELESLLTELGSDGANDRGTHNAVAMLLADAALDADDVTLSAGQRSLKRLYSRQLAGKEDASRSAEARGRLLAYLDIVQWLLRRAAPPA